MFNIEFDRDIYWRIVMFFSVVVAVLACSDVAFASPDSNDVIGQTLCRVTTKLQGNIAKAIATIAIFVIGVSLFMGKVNWGTAAMVAAGIGIVFGAGQMVAWVGGTAGGVCAT